MNTGLHWQGALSIYQVFRVQLRRLRHARSRFVPQYLHGGASKTVSEQLIIGDKIVTLGSTERSQSQPW